MPQNGHMKSTFYQSIHEKWCAFFHGDARTVSRHLTFSAGGFTLARSGKYIRTDGNRERYPVTVLPGRWVDGGRQKPWVWRPGSPV